MDFVTHFYFQTILATIVAYVWFSLPGLWVAWLIGLKAQKSGLLLLAPVFGVCVFGGFSLALNTLIGYNLINLVGVWLLFQTLMFFWLWQYPPLTEPKQLTLTWKITFLFFVGSALWAGLLTIFAIVPFYANDGLYVNSPIFDHAKVALVDVIAREGLLPINPYYAPNGEDIPLIYYYTWYFLASQLKLLTGASGWAVEVAFTGLTAFITLNFLIFLAVRTSQRYSAGVFVILLAFTGMPSDYLPQLLGHRYLEWVALPAGHGLELLWQQARWVPQHVLSALSVVILLYCVQRISRSERPQWALATVAGLVTATGFGASTWVGGVGLGLATPFLLLALVLLHLSWQQYRNLLLMAVYTIGVCVVFALPALISQASGPPLVESHLPFGFKILPATRFVPLDGNILHKLSHIILYWIQFLPLTLGITYILGLLALLLRRPTDIDERTW